MNGKPQAKVELSKSDEIKEQKLIEPPADVLKADNGRQSQTAAKPTKSQESASAKKSDAKAQLGLSGASHSSGKPSIPEVAEDSDYDLQPSD